MRVRVRNSGTFDEQWHDEGRGHGQRHHWDRERRTIEDQLAAAFPPLRRVTLPQMTVSLERAA